MDVPSNEQRAHISAVVIADSISPAGARITTLALKYPRFIHAEFMTHRVFSRNASSSRAIPIAKLAAQASEDPAMPVHWGANQPGMQAAGEVDEEIQKQAVLLWQKAAHEASANAFALMELGIHKQVANRLLEPFLYISVIVTSTEWDNFFELRAHPDAQPEIQALAYCMKQAMEQSQPSKIVLDIASVKGWHLPYVSDDEKASLDLPTLLQISAARCARVSYLTHDGVTPSVDNDKKLFDRLVGSVPLHASPVEHQATPLADRDEWNKNFRGWMQQRTLIEKSFSQ